MTKVGDDNKNGNGDDWKGSLLMKVDLSTPAPAPEDLSVQGRPEGRARGCPLAVAGQRA